MTDQYREEFKKLAHQADEFACKGLGYLPCSVQEERAYLLYVGDFYSLKKYPHCEYFITREPTGPILVVKLGNTWETRVVCGSWFKNRAAKLKKYKKPAPETKKPTCPGPQPVLYDGLTGQECLAGMLTYQSESTTHPRPKKTEFMTVLQWEVASKLYSEQVREKLKAFKERERHRVVCDDDDRWEP